MSISFAKLSCIRKILDRWLDYKVLMDRIPGMSVGVICKDSDIFLNAYGFSDKEERRMADGETLYRIASISKLFTSIAIMQLVEQEKVALDSKVSKYLGWFKNRDGSKSNITIRQLLTHSSGISRDGNTPFWEDDKFPEVKYLKKHISEGAITYPTIERFKYSNFGYAILGQIISKVSRMSYEKYVNKNIIRKVGMKDTYVDITPQAARKLAVGYGRELPGLAQERFLGQHSTEALAPATGFISNVPDLCKFMRAQFLSNDTLLSRDTKKEMQRTQWILEDEEIRWGLGYEISRIEGNRVVGHSGGFPGYSTLLEFDPQKEIGVVVLVNAIDVSTYSLVEGIYHIVTYILENYHRFKGKEEINLKKYEGRYYSRFGDVEIVEINGSLNLFTPGRGKPLKDISQLAYKNGKFVMETGGNFDYIGEEVKFNFDSEGKVLSMSMGGSLMIPFDRVVRRMY
jgi:D-alanyl-D-alanine carboxypeptidase